MALIVNGAAIAPSGKPSFTGVALKSVRFGSTEVWKGEQTLITGWVVNDSNGGEGETSQTKSWDVSGYDTAEIIFTGNKYDTRAWPDWTCHNRIVVNGTTYTCNGSTITKTISLGGAATLSVQVISSAWGGGLANAYPVTVTSIRVY